MRQQSQCFGEVGGGRGQGRLEGQGRNYSRMAVRRGYGYAGPLIIGWTAKRYCRMETTILAERMRTVG